MEKSTDPQMIIKTIKQFKYTNSIFSRAHYLIRHFIIRDMQLHRQSTYSLLDVGAGGGDLAIWLVRLCRKKRINIQVTCLDIDETITNYLKSITAGYPEIRVVRKSVFALAELGRFDYIFSNHLLHNFSSAELSRLFDIFYLYTNHLYLLNDLHRSLFSYLAFYLFSALFLRHSYARTDGLLSIRKGFLVPEMEQIIACTGHPEKVCIRSYIPGRIVVIGKKTCKQGAARP